MLLSQSLKVASRIYFPWILGIKKIKGKISHVYILLKFSTKTGVQVILLIVFIVWYWMFVINRVGTSWTILLNPWHIRDMNNLKGIRYYIS